MLEFCQKNTMLKLILTLCLLLSSGSGKIPSDFVDMIEINTNMMYKEIKDPVTKERDVILVPIYTQLIVYNWNPECCRYEVASWMILDDSTGPRYDYEIVKRDNIYTLAIHGVTRNSKNKTRTIILRSKMFQQTKCLAGNDPEKENQKFLPIDKRTENLLLLQDYPEYMVEQR